MTLRAIDAPDGNSPPPVAPAAADLDLFGTANLAVGDTGVDGLITISTAQGDRGARIRWYPGRPGRKAPCLSVTVGPVPRATNHDLLPRVAESFRVPVSTWVALNHVDLLDFWNHAVSWTRDEVNSFVGRLKRLP